MRITPGGSPWSREDSRQAPRAGADTGHAKTDPREDTIDQVLAYASGTNWMNTRYPIDQA